MQRMFDMMERSIERSIEQSFGLMSCTSVDIGETDTKIIVKADVPGVPEDKLQVSVSERDMTISGDKPCFFDDFPQSDAVKTLSQWRSGRSCGKFETTFTLPAEIRPNSVEANLKDGVLSVEASKVSTGVKQPVVVKRK